MSVLSVSYFVNDPAIKECIIASDDIRRKTLDSCYNIPGYDKLPRDEKNKIYDALIVQLKLTMNSYSIL